MEGDFTCIVGFRKLTDTEVVFFLAAVVVDGFAAVDDPGFVVFVVPELLFDGDCVVFITKSISTAPSIPSTVPASVACHI